MLLLQGCSGQEKDEELALDGPSSQASVPAPSASPGEPEAPQTLIPEQPVDGEFILGLNPASTDEEKEVAQVWFDFWAELFVMYSDVTVNEATFSELARGRGYDIPTQYVALMRQRGTHNVGGNIASIRSISRKGKKFVVEGCIRGTLIELEPSGRPVEDPLPYWRSREVLKKIDGQWRVVDKGKWGTARATSGEAGAFVQPRSPAGTRTGCRPRRLPSAVRRRGKP